MALESNLPVWSSTSGSSSAQFSIICSNESSNEEPSSSDEDEDEEFLWIESRRFGILSSRVVGLYLGWSSSGGLKIGFLLVDFLVRFKVDGLRGKRSHETGRSFTFSF